MLTSHELLGFMSPKLALEILTYTFETDKAVYRTTLNAVAEARRVRPVFLERQPKPQRHAAMVASLTRPGLEMITANLIRTWLLKKYKEMLCDFLDALGIAHKDGVVEDLPDNVEDAKLNSGIDVILGKYPREVVAVYLHAFQEMNEVQWPNLKTLLESDKRLELGESSAVH